jgi:hypothetical protein
MADDMMETELSQAFDDAYEEEEVPDDDDSDYIPVAKKRKTRGKGKATTKAAKAAKEGDDDPPGSIWVPTDTTKTEYMLLVPDDDDEDYMPVAKKRKTRGKGKATTKTAKAAKKRTAAQRKLAKSMTQVKLIANESTTSKAAKLAKTNRGKDIVAQFTHDEKRRFVAHKTTHFSSGVQVVKKKNITQYEKVVDIIQTAANKQHFIAADLPAALAALARTFIADVVNEACAVRGTSFAGALGALTPRQLREAHARMQAREAVHRPSGGAVVTRAVAAASSLADDAAAAVVVVPPPRTVSSRPLLRKRRR